MPQNVSLRLTDDQEVLKTLEAKGAYVKRGPAGKDRKPTGDKTYVVKADSHAYEFVPGRVITVPERVAYMIRQNSGVFVGGTPRTIKIDGVDRHFNSELDADYVPAIEVVEQWEVGTEQPSARKSRRTTCPLCDVDQGTVERLRNHMLECQEDAAAIESAKAAAAVGAGA